MLVKIFAKIKSCVKFVYERDNHSDAANLQHLPNFSIIDIRCELSNTIICH